jgi:hypothetical protein
MCGRPIDKVAHWVAGRPIGPKCFLKAFGKHAKAMKSQAVTDDRTADMFAEFVAEKPDNS